MKLFLDRNKTLLPRIDVIYLLTRLMTLLGVTWFLVVGDYREEDATFLYILGGTFAAHLLVFFVAIKGKFDVKLAYLATIVYDLIFVPAFVLLTGGVNSSFYLLFYLTVAVAAYMLSVWLASAVVVATTALYVVVVMSEIDVNNLFDFSMRLGFMWVFYLALSYASEFLRKSETRLMKLFDTLNLRTSELEKSQAQLEVIYENSRILAAILDTDGVVHEVMRIMGSTLQYSHYALVFTDKWGHFYYRARAHDRNHNFHLKAIDDKDTELLRRVSQQHEAIRIKNVRDRQDHRPIHEGAHSVMIVPMTTHGHTNGILIAEADQTDHFKERDVQMLSIVARSAALALENAELHKRTEELTMIDELTETFNYRYFIQKLQEEKKRALRYNLPLSIIMVDIDWFKKLNDSYGHEVGNLVLKELSRVIKKCIRDVDIFARYGGEEFVVILPQTPEGEAANIGERIREQIEKTVIDTGAAGKVKVTVSVGVSAFPENGRSHEELVSVADQALYRAKGSGKNAVCTI
ncbi:MAG: sensor domain-containing diguanylate cyclase [Candidatus Zixiibacteriota bacterium]